MAWRISRIQTGIKLEYFSVGWMTIEVCGALLAGLTAKSFALLAFGSDSSIELLSSLFVLRHLRADSMGRSALGVRTATLTSILLIALIPSIGVPASYFYFVAGTHPETSPLGITIAVGALMVMPILWLQKRNVGRETRCLPLSTDAVASATCVLMSLALLFGLLGEFFFGVGWLDFAATIVILAFVGREAAESFKEARSN